MNTAAEIAARSAIARHAKPFPVAVASDGDGSPPKSLSNVEDQRMQSQILSVQEDRKMIETKVNSVEVEIKELKKAIATSNDAEEKNNCTMRKCYLLLRKANFTMR